MIARHRRACAPGLPARTRRFRLMPQARGRHDDADKRALRSGAGRPATEHQSRTTAFDAIQQAGQDLDLGGATEAAPDRSIAAASRRHRLR
jgi:hypothetical protein